MTIFKASEVSKTSDAYVENGIAPEKGRISPSGSLHALGDFSSLSQAQLTFRPSHNLLTSQWSTTDGTKLGNLSKIVGQLRQANLDQSELCHISRPPSTDASVLCSTDTKAASDIAAAVSASLSGSTKSSEAKSCHIRESESEPCESDPGLQLHTSNIRILSRRIPAFPVHNSTCSSDKLSEKSHIAAKSKTKDGKVRVFKKPPSGQLLSYQMMKNGPVSLVLGEIYTEKEAHESLTLKLIPHFAHDSLTAKLHHKITSNGIHVFLDMSNIDISFHNSLRDKYSLPSNARFYPLPRLNLSFLTEVLVRSREIKRMYVGCSVLPGKPEPQYIQHLRNLGYTADVRNRKRAEISEAPYNSGSTPRYMEDLVDETLQTRMAESAMACFKEQGTIVLATGDAKPAQYSDGFFTYVERALNMGWNVEIASWRNSLSTSWTDPNWRDQWGDRFRIIELDEFLTDLLQSYV